MKCPIIDDFVTVIENWKMVSLLGLTKKKEHITEISKEF